MSDAPSKPGWKQRLLRELTDYWLTFVYLLFYFGVFTMYRRLILAEYQISYVNYGFAIIKALVLAKVILVGDLFLGRALRQKPLALPTLLNATAFTVLVAVFVTLEHTLAGLLHGEGMTGGVKELMSKGKDELLAGCLVVFFSFIPFFALRELSRVLGEGKIWNLFFRRGTRAEPQHSD